MIAEVGVMCSGTLLLLAQASAQPSGIALFLPLILIMVIFYFLMIMPAQRRQKKVAEMLRSLKTGDKVITNGGIYGTMVGLDDDSVQLRIAEQVKIKVSRTAIAGLQAEPEGDLTSQHEFRAQVEVHFYRHHHFGVHFRRCRHAGISHVGPTVKQNLADRIKLGLDLKGGSHLVLQVQVDEAIGQRCDETIDAFTKQLHEKNVNVGEIRRVDDTHILVRNIDPATSSTFRDIVADQFTDWSMSPAPGEQNGYLLTMKPSVVADIRRNDGSGARNDYAAHQRSRPDRADDCFHRPRRQ